MSDKRLTIVSLDGHAAMPPELWPRYLDERVHRYLPKLYKENERFTMMQRAYFQKTHNTDDLDVFDLENAVRDGGADGLFNLDVRLAEMDREGIAAEFVHNGDPRIVTCFFGSSNQPYPLDVCQAGAMAYHRWLYDTFGLAKDRLLLIGVIGHSPWRSMDELLAELDWIADRGFPATSIPGFTTYPGQPVLSDSYWDPFWKRCQERNIALWMHAGHGESQAEIGTQLQRMYAQMEAENLPFEELTKRHIRQFNENKVFESIKPRRAMWQMMLSGVFDRFPGLKLVMNEVYADWIPRTIQLLDEEYEKRRAEIPAKLKPSQYWGRNLVGCLSFARRCEMEVRDQIGVETMAFGRDYPHPEGTWPNTKLWLRDVLSGVSEDEIRAILGENIIRILKLDADVIHEIAEKVGPTLEEIAGHPRDLPEPLLAHFAKRGDYLRLGEGEARVQEMRDMLAEDIWRVSALV